MLVVVQDGYPGVRGIATDRLAPRGVEIRFVPTDTAAIVAACDGATMVWVESPSNPGLDVCDIRAIADAVHASGGRLAVDNTLCTPLGQRPLDLGADAAMVSATKALSGHSDIVLGAVATRDPEWVAPLRKHRSQGGSIAGPFEAWMLHRSLPTLALRLGAPVGQRGADGGVAAAPPRRARRAPPERAGRLGADDLHRAARLLHARGRGARAARSWTRSSSSRRRRPSAACTPPRSGAGAGGRDAVEPGFIRFSCGCEDVEDLLADVEQALAASARG